MTSLRPFNRSSDSSQIVVSPRKKSRAAKTLRDVIALLAARRDWGRVRAATCFRILDVPEPFLDPIIPATFDRARRHWLEASRAARDAGDKDREVAINLAWTHLKNWRCCICGGLKKRTRNETCGGECGQELSRRQLRQQFGPIVLRMSFRGRRMETGKRARTNGLRRAQFNALKAALDQNRQCVAKAARALGMSYQNCKYWIRKFGGFQQIAKDEAATHCA